jgi:hypothetical protein
LPDETATTFQCATRGAASCGCPYAYRFGVAARLATKAYLTTVGRDKVGFSIVGRDSAGKPQFVGGTRGAIERNTMRYYLAIEAYLGALSLPTAQQLETVGGLARRRRTYPRQLRELDRGEYIAMKREQVRRQQQLSGR